MESIDLLVGIKIRQIREYKKLSQEELAHRSLLQPAQIGYIERADRSCKVSTLQKIANGLNVELFELFLFTAPYYEEKIDQEISNTVTKILASLRTCIHKRFSKV